MVWQACQYVGEPGLWIDIVELASFDQRIESGSAAAAVIGARKGPVVAADCDTAQAAFGSIVG